MVADAALVRPACVVVLHPVAAGDEQRPVVEADRHLHRKLAVRGRKHIDELGLEVDELRSIAEEDGRGFVGAQLGHGPMVPTMDWSDAPLPDRALAPRLGMVALPCHEWTRLSA